MLDSIVAFLQNWKELVGAFLGGVFSLLVALLVAYQARRAEERTAATLLVGDFLRVDAMVQNACTSLEGQDFTQEEMRPLLVKHLCRFRVKLSPLFDASIARVTHCDVYLAATMTLASSFIRDTEPVLIRLEEDVAYLDRMERPKRNNADIDADINVVFGGYKLIAAHAKYSAKLLEQMVLGAFPTWHKIRRRFWSFQWEKDFFELLKRGNV